jgi:hypothetical protein
LASEVAEGGVATAQAVVPQSIEWGSLITAAEVHRPQPIQARTYIRSYGTASSPVELSCADGNSYVAKCLRNNSNQGKMIFNDQVAARLGALIGAPVPVVTLIDIPNELIAHNPQMSHILPGVAHGSLKVANVTDRIDSFDHMTDGDNRSRFAALAIFFGWLLGGDRQFIFEKSPPYAVYSHDHGHFFPNGPNWTIASLNSAPSPAQAWPDFVSAINCTAEELRTACALLHHITREQIATALAIPPSEWGVPIAERVTLAEFLYRRRTDLLAAHPIPI